MKLKITLKNISRPGKLIILVIMIPAFFNSNVFSQNILQRLGNPYYTQTVLFDDFKPDTLNRDVWNVISGIMKGDLFVFTDSLATVNQSNGRLNLTMVRHPGYAPAAWTPEGMENITAGFISGEVMTVKDFSYGIFECNATLASGRGSFPAFWLYNDTPCHETARPEIDIVELKASHKKPTLDNNIWYYPVNCLPQTSHEFEKHKFIWGGPHTFKCIWTPQKIEFWADSVKLKEVKNSGQYWYPQLPQHVILSQQVVKLGRSTKKIITPQTSHFNWVKVREFFLAPEIICPDNINLPETAILNVDAEAKNITWELTPPDIFTSATKGTGANAEIIPSDYFHSAAKIIFNFEMPSGESFSAEKEFMINGLH